MPQKLAEAGDHPPNPRRIALDEGRNRVQGVEEEMRIHLHAQRVETRFGQLCLQLDRLPLPALIAQEVFAREARRQDGEKHQELIHETKTPQISEWSEHASAAPQRVLEDHVPGDVHNEIDGHGHGQERFS